MKCNVKLAISPGGAGEGHGDAVLGTTLCGVDWVEEGPLAGWCGAPNKSPRRSAAAAAVDVGWDDWTGWLISSPSNPNRSTSSAGGAAAGVGAGGSGFWGAVLVLLLWPERDSISSSEGSLSSPWHRLSGPPWGRVGSAGHWDEDRWERDTRKEMTAQLKEIRQKTETLCRPGEKRQAKLEIKSSYIGYSATVLYGSTLFSFLIGWRFLLASWRINCQKHNKSIWTKIQSIKYCMC